MSRVKHSTDWEEILDLLDGEIPADRGEFLKQHLRECEECRAKLDGLEKVSRAIHNWDVPELSADRAKRMLQNVEPRNPTRPGFNWELARKLWRLRPLFVVVGVTVAAGLALLFWNSRSRYQTSVDESQRTAFHQAELTAYDSKLPAQERPIQELVPLTPGLAPMIARSVSLAIVAKDFGEARASLEAILARHQGYAAELTVSTEQNSARSLQASLRIPAGEFVATVTELKALGVVEAESQKGEEVTQQHSDLVARLKNSRETEQRLQAILLQRTGKMSDVLEVEQEISRVRGEIEGMEAEQKALEHRVGFATVDLRIGEEYRAQLGAPSLANRFRNAVVSGFQSAADTIVAVLLWFLNYGPTLVLWLAIFFLPMRFLWRRSKLLMRRDAV